MRDTATKLRDHIVDGDGHVVALNSMITIAMLLSEQALRDRSAADVEIGPSQCVVEALDTAVDEIAKRAAEIHSWWNQLHELGVVAGWEKANG